MSDDAEAMDFRTAFPNLRPDSELADKLNQALRDADPRGHSPFCSIAGADPQACHCYGWHPLHESEGTEKRD